MKRLPPLPRPVTRRDVKKFVDHCVNIRTLWAHYQILFNGSDLKRQLLQITARQFFQDLNIMLIDSLILYVCKITDPEFTGGRRNLTIQYFMKNADLSASPRDIAKLTKIDGRISAFRKRIEPARNKRISHLDLDAATVMRKSLGGASVAAWRGFWRDLQDFIEIMHRRYVNKRNPINLSRINISDADQLVKSLKESTYFQAAIKEKNLTSKIDAVASNSKYYDVVDIFDTKCENIKSKRSVK